MIFRLVLSNGREHLVSRAWRLGYSTTKEVLRSAPEYNSMIPMELADGNTIWVYSRSICTVEEVEE